jgi:hypothetical protein
MKHALIVGQLAHFFSDFLRHAGPLGPELCSSFPKIFPTFPPDGRRTIQHP